MLISGKILNRKVVFIFVVVLILCVVGGFFWWQNREIKGSPADYIIKETAEGKIVENKKAGLAVEVQEGWEIKKMETEEGSMVIHTLGVEGKNWNEMVVPPLTKGCGIDVSVVYKRMDFEEIKDEVRRIHWSLNIKSEEFEEITINNYSALKNTFDSEILGSAISIYIPSKNKLYDIDLYWAPDEKEKCVQEFDKFLETVSIQ